jgi:hypothetical protein
VLEALKRLEQAGLVRVSQGGATRVRDWRHEGGLDLLTQLGVLGKPDIELLRSELEMRLCIGVDAARQCAERAPSPTATRSSGASSSTAPTTSPRRPRGHCCSAASPTPCAPRAPPGRP